MNTETLEKMQRLRFTGMYKAFKTSIETERTSSYTADELIEMLVDAELDERQTKSREMKIRNAKFRYKASLEDMNYHLNRNIDKNQLIRLGTCEYIDKSENILITGSTGIGKSYVSSALGHEACNKGYKVAYYNTPKLFAKLKMAKADGSYLKEIVRLERQDLLILDDFGIQPFDAQNRSTLMEIIEDRHGKKSMIITSQLPIINWYEVIGEKTIADAILDRIVHDAHRLELVGESLRKQRKLTALSEGIINDN
jgi:DNA replication protein DnaC